MTLHSANNDTHHGHHHGHDTGAKVIFGFWVYLMTDLIMFAAVFATYIVLHNSTYGGPSIAALTSLSHALVQTLIMLGIGFVYGLGLVAAKNGRLCQVRFWLLLSLVLAGVFFAMGLCELHGMMQQGYDWQTSAALSSFFTLIAMHGIHIVIGIIWTVILLVQLSMQKLSSTLQTRLSCLGLFWNFLTIVWILIYTIVYLMGAI